MLPQCNFNRGGIYSFPFLYLETLNSNARIRGEVIYMVDHISCLEPQLS
jgi:hypothetical protein